MKQQSEGNSPCVLWRTFKCKHLRNSMMAMKSFSDKRPKMAAKRWQDRLYWGSEPQFFHSSFSAQIPQVDRGAHYQGTNFFSPHLFSGSQLISVIVGAPRDGGRFFQSVLQLTFAHSLVLISSGLLSFRVPKGLCASPTYRMMHSSGGAQNKMKTCHSGSLRTYERYSPSPCWYGIKSNNSWGLLSIDKPQVLC